MPPDSSVAPIWVIGTVTWDQMLDQHGAERRPGGTALYTARTCDAFGVSAYILHASGLDADQAAFGGHRSHRIDGPTLTLLHEFPRGERRQTLLQATGRTIVPDDAPRDWPSPKTLILAPLLPDEVDVIAFIDDAPDAEIGLLAQGLQRAVLPDGTIAHRAQPSSDLIDAARPNASIFLSREEVRLWPAGSVEHLAARSARVVITEGADGAVVYDRHGSHRIDPVPADPVDTTGAGDVFAAALILAMRAGEEFAEQLAAACSAAATEVVGPGVLPPLRDIQQRAAISADRTADGGSSA